jgi:2',3'-cyclic-nucleotide 2'-phosphodiesterase (5'-nucleotidase family)
MAYPITAAVALLTVAAATACQSRAAPIPTTSQAAVVLRLIGTNDFHGALEPRPNPAGVPWGGAAALAGAIARARSECVAPACVSMLLDAGDDFQGQAASTLEHGRPVSAIFNAIGFDVAALGNHDLDWGRDVFRQRRAEQHYAVLSANTRYDDGRPVEWVRSDTIIRRGPFVVGVIGIMTMEAPISIAAVNIVGLRFIDPAPVVDSLARSLRRRGANVIVLLAHAGGRCDPKVPTPCHGEIFDVVGKLTEKVDAVISGHSHELTNGAAHGIPITGARTAGQALGIIDLTSAGKVLRRDVRLVFADSVTPDPRIVRMVSEAVTAAGPRLNAPVATVAENLERQGNEYPLGNLVVDAMRAAGHADFAAENETGVRAPLKAGVATFASVFEIQPFANRLLLVTASGASMKQYFERMVGPRGPFTLISGATITVDTTRAAGARITSVRLPSGAPMDEHATYTIVVSDFMYNGGLNLDFPDRSAPMSDLAIVDVDATLDYLRKAPSPVQAPREHRWVVTPWR